MGSVGDLPGSPSYAAILSSDDNTVKVESKSPVHVVKRSVGIRDQPYIVGVAEDREGSQTSNCAKVSKTCGFCIVV